ncbi:MAG: DUF2589 domain-containing protein [Crocinitomicaceae bacterium]|nr:DUF2589 domain-containing protein [Crocinitomicaceae bacterium]
MAEMANQMAGLPIESLICEPLIAVAKGQNALVDVYLNQLFKLAYTDGDPEKGTRLIKFNLERPVTDGQGNLSKQTIEVEAPLLSLVPVPAFTMQEATVEFSMEIKSQESSTNKSEASLETSASASGGYFGVSFSASVTGKASTSSENTRSSDQSSKYVITAKAVQQPPSEGMAKLTQLFASVIEPIDVGSPS